MTKPWELTIDEAEEAISCASYQLNKGRLVAEVGMLPIDDRAVIARAAQKKLLEYLLEREGLDLAIFCMDGIRRGLQARRDGDMIPWKQVKEELGI